MQISMMKHIPSIIPSQAHPSLLFYNPSINHHKLLEISSSAFQMWPAIVTLIVRVFPLVPDLTRPQYPFRVPSDWTFARTKKNGPGSGSSPETANCCAAQLGRINEIFIPADEEDWNDLVARKAGLRNKSIHTIPADWVASASEPTNSQYVMLRSCSPRGMPINSFTGNVPSLGSPPKSWTQLL